MHPQRRILSRFLELIIMARKMIDHEICTSFVIITVMMLNAIITVNAIDDDALVPSDPAKLDGWFRENVRPFSDSARSNIDPALIVAESNQRIIRVRKDGSGDFTTISAAINSIPVGNTRRVIVWIGGGKYVEKLKVERGKPFVTFYGSPSDMPTLVYDGTAAKYGTVDSATLIVESNYFTAANIRLSNSAPRPDGKRVGAQAAALRISGDKAAFYNTYIYGFQDTVCDDTGRHFFKDCYIEGTVDFIFGDAKSIYLNTELHVIPGDRMAVITAHARKSEREETGYVFLHGKVSGSGKTALLGRAWFPFSKVIYAYTYMTDAVNPRGWSNFPSQDDKTVYYGEYMCRGPGSDQRTRVSFMKRLSSSEATQFLKLGFIQASNWLLPPPVLSH